MIWTRRVTRGGANPDVLFPDQVLVGEFFSGRVAPEFLSDSLVEAFGECLRQPVRECLAEHAAIVVTICLELSAQLFYADTSGDGKCTHIVGDSSVFGRHEVRKADVRPARCF